MAGRRSEKGTSKGAGLPRRKAAGPGPYEQISQAIRTGEFAPGQLLTENGLAEWCGVSRTPVREALVRLQGDGLIERTGRGPVVRSRTLEEIFNIYEVRIGLEAMAARAGAERRTERDLILMRAALAAYEDLPMGASPELVTSSHAFHEGVWRASRNETMGEMLARLDLQVPRHPNETMGDSESRARVVAQHRAIFEAIQAQDGDAAAAAATAHYTEARDIRMKAGIVHDGLAR